MEQKYIGIILIILSLLITAFVFMVHSESDAIAEQYMADHGTCFLDDGTCLHKQNQFLYSLGWALAGTLLIFGIYITFFDRSQTILREHQVKVSKALENAKRQDKEKDEFNAYLAGFDQEEQKILKALKAQDGIWQSTLRYKTGMSKTNLSLILKSLEERKIISRNVKGKTKEVYLIKKF